MISETTRKPDFGALHCYDARYEMTTEQAEPAIEESFDNLTDREITIALMAAHNMLQAVAWFPKPVGVEGEPEYEGRDKMIFDRGYESCWEIGRELLLSLMEDRLRETKQITLGEWKGDDSSS